MSKYVFPAVLTPEDGGQYSVRFPDVNGCFTSGHDLHHALYMAQDVLNVMVMSMEDEKIDIPEPTPLADVPHEEGDIVTLVSCDTIEYRKRWDDKTIKKTVTMPNWLNSLAEDRGINFSQVLQRALKRELDIEEY